MEVYAFGHGIDKAWVGRQQVSEPVFTASHVEIVWASWCDLIFAYSSSKHPATSCTLTHHGTNLTPLQKSFIQNLEYLPRPLGSSNQTPRFFGAPLDTGVQGVLFPPSHDAQHQYQEIALFNSGPAMANNTEIQTLKIPTASVGMVLDIGVTSRKTYIITLSTLQNTISILHMTNLSALTTLSHHHQQQQQQQQIYTSTSPDPPQFTINASTLTLIPSPPAPQIPHTYPLDSRYPKTLGRESTLAHSLPAEITYLSMTPIQKVVAGGYYTLALSHDGELFIWGQAAPGMGCELGVLKGRDGDEDEDEDEFVKNIGIQFQGREARVVHVAVGWGHVLVCVEVDVSGGGVERALFAAGGNERGQLGPDGGEAEFVREFVEVDMFRGKRVRQLACAGWSSYLVVDNVQG